MALQVGTGCTAKTLLVNPYTTTEEVCSLCAKKLKIQEPEQYALFLVTAEMRQQLAPDTHPQRIKAELYSRPRTHTFHFLYRKVTDLNLCIPADRQNGVFSVWVDGKKTSTLDSNMLIWWHSINDLQCLLWRKIPGRENGNKKFAAELINSNLNGGGRVRMDFRNTHKMGWNWKLFRFVF